MNLIDDLQQKQLCNDQHAHHHTMPIRLGVTDLSFHRVTAAVVAQVMRRMGKQVELSYALHEANFNRLKLGQIDLLCSAWLPHSHGVYRQEVETQAATRELGLHYEPYALWGVPDYVPEDAVSRIAAAGYQFRTGTQADCVAAFESAVSVRDWVIVPLWHPQFLHHQYGIRDLQDSKGLLGGKDKAVLLARERELVINFSPAQIQVLDSIVLSNQIVAELDYAVNRQGMTEDEAAANWLEANPSHLTTWLAPLLNPTNTSSSEMTL